MPSGAISSPFLNNSVTSSNNFLPLSTISSACFCALSAKELAASFVALKLSRAVFISSGTLCLLMATTATVPAKASAARPPTIAAVFLLIFPAFCTS